MPEALLPPEALTGKKVLFWNVKLQDSFLLLPASLLLSWIVYMTFCRKAIEEMENMYRKVLYFVIYSRG